MKRRLFPLLALLALGGCRLLQPVRDSAVQHLLEPLVAERSLNATTPAIAIDRPALPMYLDRQQLVTRREGALEVSHLDVWAEPLDVGISRVMASNLSRLTGSMNIQPVERFSTLDYTELLELRLTQFDPDAANGLVLQGTWKLQPVAGGDAASHYFHITVPMRADPESAMKERVSAMNHALVRLAQEIAKGG